MLLVPLLGPVADLVNFVALLTGWSVRRVDWAHCRYHLDQGRVVHIDRQPWAK